ncbi:uncharacterized protein simc1 [Labrus mixtus]|uniref:uncharacterized protein simc1 n=1 Tax=Labrus mixtus TaxID=508554 RepID=UPI0029C0DC4D|nr:uncharacterized protein simc1 [Labrus mixtus]
MGDVIVLSSDNDEEDSDVEIVGSYSHFMSRGDPLPLTAVRVDVESLNVNVPTGYINLTDPRWTLPDLKVHKRKNSTSLAVMDLTEIVTKEESDNLPPDYCQIKEDSKNKIHTLNEQDFNIQKSPSSDSTALQEDCLNLKQRQICLDSQSHQKQTTKENNCVPTIKLKWMPFHETHVKDLKMPRRSVSLTKDPMQMSPNFIQQGITSETPECSKDLRTTSASNSLRTEPLLDNSLSQTIISPVRKKQEELPSKPLNVEISQRVRSPTDFAFGDSRENSTFDTRDDLCSDIFIDSSSVPFSPFKKTHDPFQSQVLSSDPEKLISDKADSAQSVLSNHSPLYSTATGLNLSEPTDLNCLPKTSPQTLNFKSEVDAAPTSGYTPAENMCKWQMETVKVDEASNSSDLLGWSIPCEPLLSVPKTDDMDSGSGSWQYEQDRGIDSPMPYTWQEVNTESRFDEDFRAASRDDRHFVCPVTLKKIMSGPAPALTVEKEEGFRPPKLLCRQSLSLVYSTIDENYPEGTLQLLSDLLQPGFYPPKDITVHLMNGILLDPKCPYHLCVQAFSLLMRTQRHHIVDKSRVPWDWELLTTCMINPDNMKRHQIDVVRMLLEYVVQTLEDDFKAKHSSSTLQHSIAKATLSCDKQFSRVKDVIKWLFTAIMKSTENGESREAARERDEQIRIIYILQRMLSLALEVDHSPALTSAKLSQELFHMLIGSVPIRAHRMLLLECLQSKLLRCKLLEHLLDYACPLKVSLPMSLSLLLHFLKHCTLDPDPMDGTERWKRWEELVHLLWMLLLSYNKAMKGYLCSSVVEQSGRVGTKVYKPDDMVSKPAVHEAIKAFLSRSQEDLGQALPLHVEESLTYLQEYLLDVCQS